MVLSEKQRLLAGGLLIVILLILLYVVLTHTKSHPTNQSTSSSSHSDIPEQPRSHPSASLSNPQKVPSGQLPADGLKFVIASLSTGKYLGDATLMTDDINSAKIFTYNSKLGHTIEDISNANTNDSNPFDGLIINFSGEHALVGSLDTLVSCPNHTAAYGIILGAQKWNWGIVNCNVPAALSPEYLPMYGAVFYYV
jgi:hypothetical protein